MNPKRYFPIAALLGIALLVAPLSQSPAQSPAETLAGGTWINKSYDIHGSWKIVARDDARYIVFDEDFKTRRGPDLKVYLSTRSVAEVSDKTVAASSIEIAPLQSRKGAQEYEIPEDLDLADYRSLLIHCKKYSHLWGGGDLDPLDP